MKNGVKLCIVFFIISCTLTASAISDRAYTSWTGRILNAFDGPNIDLALKSFICFEGGIAYELEHDNYEKTRDKIQRIADVWDTDLQTSLEKLREKISNLHSKTKDSLEKTRESEIKELSDKILKIRSEIMLQSNSSYFQNIEKLTDEEEKAFASLEKLFVNNKVFEDELKKIILKERRALLVSVGLTDDEVEKAIEKFPLSDTGIQQFRAFSNIIRNKALALKANSKNPIEFLDVLKKAIAELNASYISFYSFVVIYLPISTQIAQFKANTSFSLNAELAEKIKKALYELNKIEYEYLKKLITKYAQSTIGHDYQPRPYNSKYKKMVADANTIQKKIIAFKKAIEECLEAATIIDDYQKYRFATSMYNFDEIIEDLKEAQKTQPEVSQYEALLQLCIWAKDILDKLHAQKNDTSTGTGSSFNKKPFDHYSELEIDKNATPAEIKKAYRKLMLIWHPDKKPWEKYPDKFKPLLETYEKEENARGLKIAKSDYPNESEAEQKKRVPQILRDDYKVKAMQVYQSLHKDLNEKEVESWFNEDPEQNIKDYKNTFITQRKVDAIQRASQALTDHSK